MPISKANSSINNSSKHHDPKLNGSEINRTRNSVEESPPLLSRELILGPSREVQARIESSSDTALENRRTTFGVIKDSLRKALEVSPTAFYSRLGLSAVLASLPLIWSHVSGQIVGTLTEIGSHGRGVAFAVASIGIMSLMVDGISRGYSVFSSWLYRRNMRALDEFASKTVGSWSYEEQEEGEKRFAFERFRSHGGRIFDLVSSVVDLGSASAGSIASTILISAIDYRLGVAAGLFAGLRIYRDYRESQVSFSLERNHAELGRQYNVKKELSSNPHCVRDTKQFGKHEILHNEYQQDKATVDKIENGNELRVQLIRLALDIVPAAVVSVGLGLLGLKFVEGSADTAGLVASIGYLWTSANALRAVGFHTGSIMQFQNGAAEALSFLDTKRKTDPDLLELPLYELPPAIKLENVSVARNGRILLDQINLEIKPGEIIGVVGREGAGKSTLIKTILGMREISSGQILISWGDEVFNLKGISQHSWDRLIGNFNQDFSPPEGLTVKKAVDLGAERTDPARDMDLLEALQTVGADGFVAGNVKGVETVIGAGWKDGRAFSGGERKLLGLATAIRGNPPILILDEPTANLHPDRAQKALAQICRRAKVQGQTVIIVSHSAENFKFATRIIGIENGHIVQDGDPNVLKDTPGLYRNLLRESLETTARMLGLSFPDLTSF